MAAERLFAPVLLELELAAEGERWTEAGFVTEVADGTVLVRLGGVRLGLRGPDAGRGIVRWTLAGLPGEPERLDGALDGLPTAASTEAAPPPGPPHFNGVTAVDHVVAFSPDLDRTVGALRAGGLDFRRLREGPTAAGAQRQAFFRVGDPLLEVIEHPPDVPAAADRTAPTRFWGLALLAPDLDATAERLGPLLGEVRPAIQSGRRIATFRREARRHGARPFHGPHRSRRVRPDRPRYLGAGAAPSALGLRRLGEEEDEPEHQVQREQLDALEPVRLALLSDEVRDQDREQQPRQLVAVEDERHRGRADHER